MTHEEAEQLGNLIGTVIVVSVKLTFWGLVFSCLLKYVGCM